MYANVPMYAQEAEETAWRESQMPGYYAEQRYSQNTEPAVAMQADGASWYGSFAAGMFAGFAAVVLALRSTLRPESPQVPQTGSVELRQGLFSVAGSDPSPLLPVFGSAEPVYAASPVLRGGLQGALVASFAADIDTAAQERAEEEQRQKAREAEIRSQKVKEVFENTGEYRPLVPTAEQSMAPDYSKEPTQFERQGLVEGGMPPTPTPKTYGGESPDGGFGGLTRREVSGTLGAVGLGVAGVAWAVTRNPGYDRKSKARDAGNVEINKEAVAAPEIQTALAELMATRKSLGELFNQFKKDKNAPLSDGVSEFAGDLNNLRKNLNSINIAAFDEDTQIVTDRLSRNIIQDIVELETAVKLKDGTERSPKRVAATQKRFTASIEGLDKFLAYFDEKSAAPKK
jgi:hypothetical protein